MHALELLHNELKIACPKIHAKRLDRLLLLTESLLTGGKLTLTSLGRYSSGEAQVKNKIKAVDRFLRNEHCYSESLLIYQAISAKVIGNLHEIDVLVDWSSCGSRENHVLRASIAYRGRCLTIYEEVHPEKMLGNYKVHRRFLERLRKIISSDCHATIITDAGFRTEWFKLVAQMEWDYVGRNLSNMQYTKDGKHWEACTSLYDKATQKPQYIGEVQLSKVNKLQCSMYLYKEKRRKSVKKIKKTNQSKVSQRKRATTEKQYRKRSYQPWLLVTSKKGGSKEAEKIIKAYKRRMKIEHDFRDTKDMKCGLGLNLTRTRNTKRLAIMLLIAALAALLLMLIGLAAESKNLHYRFQANTVRKYRVLSLIFLGMQIIRHCLHLISLHDLKETIKNLQRDEARFYE